jgi:hypothetical protein
VLIFFISLQSNHKKYKNMSQFLIIYTIIIYTILILISTYIEFSKYTEFSENNWKQRHWRFIVDIFIYYPIINTIRIISKPINYVYFKINNLIIYFKILMINTKTTFIYYQHLDDFLKQNQLNSYLYDNKYIRNLIANKILKLKKNIINKTSSYNIEKYYYNILDNKKCEKEMIGKKVMISNTYSVYKKNEHYYFNIISKSVKMFDKHIIKSIKNVNSVDFYILENINNDEYIYSLFLPNQIKIIE